MALLFPLWGTKQDAANHQLENLADGTKPKDAVNLSQLQAAVAGGVQFIGPYNAATNTPDLTTSPNSIVTGDLYVVDTPGTFFGENLEVGDNLYAVVDDPSSLSDWAIVQNNIDVPVYVNDYYVSSDNTFASDTNTGLSEFSPLLTLGKALDLGEAGGVPFSVHILDNKTYTVTAVAGGERLTTVSFSIVGNGVTLIGDGVLWKTNNSRIDGMNADGTLLTFGVTGANVGGLVSQDHRWYRVANPETFYKIVPTDTSNHRFAVYANHVFGNGGFCNIDNAGTANMFFYIAEGNFKFNSASAEYAFIGDKAGATIIGHVLNCDVSNAGAGTGEPISLDNGAGAYLNLNCVNSTALGGGSIGATSNLFISATSATGLPLLYAGLGTVHDSSLSQGLNFENLAALAAPALTDIINIRDLATGDQKKTTLSELQAVLPSLYSANGTLSGNRTVTGSANTLLFADIMMTVREGVGSGLSPQAAADDFVIDGNGTNSGMSLLTAAGGNSNIYFGVFGGTGKDAFIQHVASVSELRLGVDNSNDIRIRTSDILLGKPIQVYDAPGGNLLGQFESDGTLSVDTANYETLVTDNNDIPNKKYVDDSIISNEGIVSAVATTNATTTEIDKIDNLTNELVFMIEVKATAKSDDDLQWGMWSFVLTVTKFGGVPVIRQTDVIAHNSSAGLNSGSITFSVNTGDIDIDVTGIAATNIQWDLIHKIIITSTN